MKLTIGQLLEKCQKMQSSSDAQKVFNEATISAGGDELTAWSNLKYITGYLGNEERIRILNLFSQSGISVARK